MNNKLSEAALYGLGGDIIRKLSPQSEAHPAALLFQLFVFFVNLVGRAPYWSVEGKRHYLVLFTLLVGPTSLGRKGSSLGYLKRIFEPLDPKWFKDSLKDGLSSGEGLIYHVRDATALDAGVVDKRLLVIEEEFASVLRVVAREGSTLSTTVRKCWDGESLNVMTKNSPLKATEPHVSLIGHITQTELERYIDETEIANGFGNRFLPICVSRSRVLPFGGTLEESEISSMSQQLGECVEFARTVEEMPFDKAARFYWIRIYDELTSREPNLFGAMTARAAPQIRRLACVYALLEKSRLVSRDHLLAAHSAWKFSEDSCRYLFGQATGNTVADKIIKALSIEGSLTRSEISSKALQNNCSKPDIEKALQFLANGRMIQKVTDRPERWQLLVSNGVDSPVSEKHEQLSEAARTGEFTPRTNFGFEESGSETPVHEVSHESN